MSVVIVLANLMDVNGMLNEESSYRAAKAVEIFHAEKAEYLVTCGWAYREDTEITIADAFSKHINEEYKISTKRILAQRSSRDTVGDAFYTKILFAVPLNWKKLTVVTSDYHVERSKEIFEFIYGGSYEIKVVGSQAYSDCKTIANEALSTQAFRKTFAGIKMGDDVNIERSLRLFHPFYNGQTYPQI